MATETPLSTQPSAPDDRVSQPQLGLRGWLRFAWRQLTSMRTALFLLLLLAVGAVPGSIWPQRGIDAARTADYIAQHPTLGPWLDRLGFFEVYASPWFAAIYLLLFISLVGCVLPRTRVHFRAMRSQPPRTPARLERLAAHGTVEVDGTPEEALAAAEAALRGKRFRVARHDDESVSSERGYLKETGNLVFHLALIFVIIGVAIGHLFGWKGDVIVPVGQGFANTLSRYDTFSPGPWVDADDLSPFSLTLDRLDATFEESVTGRGQFGQPRDFTAHVTATDEPGAAPRQETVKVNHPLEMDGASAFLLGNGYAPVITVRDKDGNIVYRDATPFLAQDNNYKSVGAIKVTGATPAAARASSACSCRRRSSPRRAARARSSPTRRSRRSRSASTRASSSPRAARSRSTPSTPRSSRRSRTNKGTDVLRIWLEPGQTFELPGDRGSITFDSVERFAGLSIRSDPGKGLTLVSALLALAGLIASLVIRRRRVFVRVSPGSEAGRTVVSVGGMAKDDDDTLAEAVEEILDAVKRRMGTPR